MSTLHITNGSDAGDKIETFADGPVRITADVLHEGPAPRVEGDAWYELRARSLCAGGGWNADEVRADLALSDRTIADAVERGDNIVLWFEHDLFDQLQVIRTLDLLVRLKADATYMEDVASREDVASGFSRTVSLICIDRFPGVERFIGLGQLDAAQLASLYPSRRPVAAEQFALASAAWDAFRSPDPAALFALAVRLRADTTRDAALPFLREALFRFFAEYPSLANGLSRTETLALTALRDGPLTAGGLFAASHREEPRPFMGDLSFYDILRGLAAARVPLLTIDAAPEQADLRPHSVAITAAGRDVLSGRLDHVAVNGIDRWKGGVHLVGSDRSPWRWDARGERLVS